MRTAIAALVCVLAPALAHAQSDVSPLPRNDVTVSTGWIGSEHSETRYNRWHGSLYGGLGVGHYWTDNLKTEVEAAWLSPTKSTSYEEIIIGADRTYAESDYLFRDLKLSVAQSFQFGRNAWIHPFLAAGADVQRLQTTEDRAPQVRTIFVNGRENRAVLVPGLHERELSVRVRPFVKGGFKMYVSDRAFFVQEFKFGLRSGVDHVLWKTGVGFDF